MFGVAFLYSGSLWFLFIVEVTRCGCVWMSDLSRLPGREACVSVLVGSWISSLWSAVKCPVVSFEMSVGLV